MAEKSIRDIIKEKSIELRSVDQLGPMKASEELVNLSSLLASLNAHIVDKKFAYNDVRQKEREKHKSAADAKIYSESSEAWKEWQEAEGQKDALKELIASIKYYLKAAEEEMKQARY